MVGLGAGRDLTRGVGTQVGVHMGKGVGGDLI